MPLYEYRCRKCGVSVEKIQKFSDPPLTRCAECGGKLERVLSSPAIQFKGSGWYVTDYARKAPPESSSAAPAADKSNGSGGTKQPAEGSSPAKSGESRPPTKS